MHRARYDAKDWASHDAWVKAAIERYGRIDVLINNAGISRNMTIRNADEATLDEIWAVNCKAPLNMIRCALPHLEASGTGRVVNIASLSGKRVANDNVSYNMTKFAVMALTHGTRKIGWDKGVRATAICPSFVRTELTAGVTAVTPQQMIDPADLAELAAACSTSRTRTSPCGPSSSTSTSGTPCPSRRRPSGSRRSAGTATTTTSTC